MLWSFILVMTGGALGSGLRFAAGLILPQTPGTIPITTLLINIGGSFILGVLSALAARTNLLSHELTLLLGTGLCGGFTTYSTYSMELYTLWELDQMWMLLAYALVSLVGGVLASYWGVSIVTSYSR